MKKKKVLIIDNKKVFFKMFNKKFKSQNELSQNDFLWHDNKDTDFDSLLLVIHNQTELIEFLELYKKGTNVLICVFKKEIFYNLFFLQEMNDFTLLDASAPRAEILKNLIKYFRSNLKIDNPFLNNPQPNSLFLKNQFNETLRNIILKSVA